MKKIGVIPSRLNSSRFPNKPLCKILGKTMIEHVYKRSLLCKHLDDLIVATCDHAIVEEVERFGGKAIMTSPNHDRCTDRIAEAVKNIECDIVVNIQGDEPMLDPSMIENSINLLLQEDKDYMTVNNVSKIFDMDEFTDPNNVKVVFNKKNEALYFSREAIPSIKKDIEGKNYFGYKQVCIISFTKEFLYIFNNLSQTYLEKIESVDMLRCLENNYKVKIVETKFKNWSVDNKKDQQIVEKMLNEDSLLNQYY